MSNNLGVTLIIDSGERVVVIQLQSHTVFAKDGDKADANTAIVTTNLTNSALNQYTPVAYNRYEHICYARQKRIDSCRWNRFATLANHHWSVKTTAAYP